MDLDLAVHECGAPFAVMAIECQHLIARPFWDLHTGLDEPVARARGCGRLECRHA